MRTFVLLVALLAVGCARPAMSFRFAGDATPEQRAAFAEASARISPALKPEKRPRLDPRGDYLVSFPPLVFLDKDDDDPSNDRHVGGRECTRKGTDCPNAPSIVVRADFTGESLVRILMHELLHAAGLRHVARLPAVMNPDGVLSGQMTPADLAECRHAKACP